MDSLVSLYHEVVDIQSIPEASGAHDIGMAKEGSAFKQASFGPLAPLETTARPIERERDLSIIIPKPKRG